MKSIFVSSTFRDMQKERDNLMIEVLPKLNDYSKNFGESFRFIDLRWGVDTEHLESDTSSEKVLSVCLDAIDSSRPYMLIFIGDRYGWVPPKDKLEQVTNRKKYPIYDFEKSVTALEIEYGALAEDRKLDRCLFYFRDEIQVPNDYTAFYKEENEDSIRKLNELKEKIKNSGAYVKTYTCKWDSVNDTQIVPDEFSEMIYNDVKELFNQEFEDLRNLSWQECAVNVNKAQLQRNNKIFLARKKELAECEKQLCQNNYRAFFLRGEEGCGKSILMSGLHETISEKFDTIYVSFKNSEYSATSELVMRQIMYKLEELLNVHHTDETSQDTYEKGLPLDKVCSIVENYINEYSKKYAHNSEKRLFIFCDELHLSYSAKEYLFSTTSNFLDFIPEVMPKNVSFVASVRDDMKLKQARDIKAKYGNYKREKLNNFIYELKKLSKSDKQKVIEGVLSYHNKELAEKLKMKMIDMKNSENALYLSVLLQRLLMLDSDDFKKADDYGAGASGINLFLENVIDTSPDNINDLYTNMITETIERIDEVFCKDLVYFIAVSYKGLKDRELQKLLEYYGVKWNALDIERFLRYTKGLFEYNHFSKLEFVSVERKRAFCARVNIKPYCEKIFRYVLGLNDKHEMKRDYLDYYACKNDEKEFFVKRLSKNKHSRISYDFAQEEVYFEQPAVDAYGLYLMALEDTKWTCEFIDSATNYGGDEFFIYSIITSFRKYFMQTPRLNDEFHLPVARRYYAFADKLCKSAKTAQDYLTVLTIYKEISSVFMLCFTLIEECKVARKDIAFKMLSIREKIFELKKDDDTKFKVLQGYYDVSQEFISELDHENAVKSLLLLIEKEKEQGMENSESSTYLAEEYIELKEYELAYKYFDISYKEMMQMIIDYPEDNYTTKENALTSSEMIRTHVMHASYFIICKREDVALEIAEKVYKLLTQLEKEDPKEFYSNGHYYNLDNIAKIFANDKIGQYEKAITIYEKTYSNKQNSTKPSEYVSELLFENVEARRDILVKMNRIGEAVKMQNKHIKTLELLAEDDDSTSSDYMRIFENYEKLIKILENSNLREELIEAKLKFEEFNKKSQIIVTTND